MKMKLGLLAGSGRFPLIFARAAREHGHQVVIIGLKGEAMRQLEDTADAMHWVELGELQSIIDILKKENITQVLMAGKIRKTILYSSQLKMDDRTSTLLQSLKNNNDDSILKGFVDEFEKEGMNVLDSITFVSDLLPKPGSLTSVEPEEDEMADFHYGWKIAKQIAGMDIGQTIVVRNRAVMAVEAIEGTDEAIRRGGRLGKEGVVVVKVAKPHQDKRFDMPVIGLDTIQVLVEVKARAIVIDAGKTIFLDREKAIALAETHGIKIYAYQNPA
jgi:hypothetical protein